MDSFEFIGVADRIVNLEKKVHFPETFGIFLFLYLVLGYNDIFIQPEVMCYDLELRSVEVTDFEL